MQHNKAIITDLSEAVDSPTGWTYCFDFMQGKSGVSGFETESRVF
jgi:hypothetical protein